MGSECFHAKERYGLANGSGAALETVVGKAAKNGKSDAVGTCVRSGVTDRGKMMHVLEVCCMCHRCSVF